MAFAIKLQICSGTGQDASENPDFRGGEPQDQHATLSEKDPVDDSELDAYLEGAKAANKLLGKLSTRGMHLEVRVMDSDGRV